MQAPTHSLVSKLSNMLARAEGRPVDAPEDAGAPAAEAEAATALDAATAQRMAQLENVTGVITKLVTGLKERMGLLHAAGQEAKIFPPPPAAVHPKLVLQVPLFADFLRQNQDAAKLVGSAVLRYHEAITEVQVLQAALGTCDVEAVNVEHVKGKYLFLAKIQVYFKDFPLLLQLFKPANQAPPPPPPAPKGVSPVDKLSLQPRPSGPSFVLEAPRAKTAELGWYTNAANARAPKPAPAKPSFTQPLGESLERQGRALVEALSLKMLILQAACDKSALIQRKSAALLPPPAQATAQQLAAVLEADPAMKERAQTFIRHFQMARQFLKAQPVPAPQLRPHLTALTSLPHQFKGNAILEQLFLKA